jgi:hypothetical protein
MTVHEGQMRWSCRLEEVKEYGCFLQAGTPRAVAEGAPRVIYRETVH